MRSLHGKHVMLCQPFFYRYSGSEVIVLELAEALHSCGARVTIATWAASSVMRSEVSSLDNVRVLELGDSAFSRLCESDPPDAAWIHQGLVPEQLIETQTRLVFAHLSSFNSFEFPFNPAIERSFADRIYFVSPEAKEAHLATGVYGDLPETVFALLENPAPDSFHDIAPLEYPSDNPTLKSLLVVSNHLPTEVTDAIAMLSNRGINVHVVGLAQEGSQHKQVRVDAELISQFDAVLSIGKTVQYALCAARPVFCYDHFGGPGWLTEANYDKARYHNFSGRGFESFSGEQICALAKDGFLQARLFTVSHLSEFRSAFGYSRVLDDIDDMLSTVASGTEGPSRAEIFGFIKAHETVGNFGRSYYMVQDQLDKPEEERDRLKQAILNRENRVHLAEGKVAELEESIAQNQAEIRHLAKQNEITLAQLAELKSSTSWRVTAPLRAIRTAAARHRPK